VASDKNDPDPNPVRGLAKVKFNIGKWPGNLAFKIVDSKVRVEKRTIPQIQWMGAMASTAGQLLQATGNHAVALDEAKEFLEALLEDGPVESSLVFKTGREKNLAEITIRRASKVLKVAKKPEEKKPEEPDGKRVWMWRLP
jgi:hypothetical protein